MFITFLLFIAIVYKRGRRVTLILALLLYLLSIRYIGNALLSPLESKYDHPFVYQKVDAVVILSGGSNGERANLPLGENSFKRAIYGIMLAKKNQLPIVFSGAGAKTYSESDAMRTTIDQLNDYLSIGLTESQTIKLNNFSISYEDSSRDTYENAAYTKDLFLKNKIKNPKIYLVTSAFHMRRSEKLYRYFGFDVVPAATDFQTAYNHSINAFLPSFTGLKMTYYALHEYAGIILLSMKLK